jgi:hypothetical protein
METSINPMHLEPGPTLKLSLMRQAPRCGATTRSGRSCQSPAVKNRKRCRMHGGTNKGAPAGERNGRYRHGLRSREHLDTRRLVRELMQEARDLAEMLC